MIDVAEGGGTPDGALVARQRRKGAGTGGAILCMRGEREEKEKEEGWGGGGCSRYENDLEV